MEVGREERRKKIRKKRKKGFGSDQKGKKEGRESCRWKISCRILSKIYIFAGRQTRARTHARKLADARQAREG